MYLLDANVFIYVLNNDPHRGKHCEKVMRFNVATTQQVLDEIKQKHDFTPKIYKVGTISPEVEELKYDSDKMAGKQLSKADKSLIQCAIDHPEICGIITNDFDIKSVSPEHLIKSETKFFIGRPNEFLKKMGKIEWYQQKMK